MERFDKWHSRSLDLVRMWDYVDYLRSATDMWLLAPKKPKDISDIDLPERAAYLYSVIGQIWRTSSEKSQVSAKVVPSTPTP